MSGISDSKTGVAGIIDTAGKLNNLGKDLSLIFK